ncbi:uncharacterized protein ATC70_000360 [Mucor velutinosus]|uniref:Stc1 domain-containing protein n=1 Tax=Mucor velutinosus TaxID=708070 RepID=A0AAN7DHF3_9FUNG|nr:hypothetical protein ATC70_000360 [Mucor velutinosus]
MTDRRPVGAYNNIAKSIRSNASAGTDAQTDIPKTLQCVFCKKDKPYEAFSTTMISKTSYNPYAPSSFNAKKKAISCKSCTATSVTHLTCMICSEKMPLNKFANTQRKNHERARCKKCIEKRQEEDVWSDNDITDSDDDY